ncbi:MAG: hypothetical protein HRT88_22550, partial [Lentisphaeraceae bacterium]|nr:hypothetical protein [Lentisphaeraceae bacterium]
MAHIADRDPDTFARFLSDEDNKVELEFSCTKTSISQTYFLVNQLRNSGLKYKMEYSRGSSWREFTWGNLNF